MIRDVEGEAKDEIEQEVRRIIEEKKRGDSNKEVEYRHKVEKYKRCSQGISRARI